MGGVCYLVAHNNILYGRGLFVKIVNLGLPLISGAAAYLLFCFIFRVRETGELLKWVRKTKRD
jgi:hypothetical protein